MRPDPDRLAALRRLMILDSQPEKAYEDITRLLATTLAVPISMVSLLDEDRDWFKACVGLPLQQSPASTSFCEAFFDIGEELILVEDTLLDERFKTHPLVLGAPHIRFYAAARLVVDGQTVGTLCAYDTQPRQLQPEQVAELQTLTRAVVALLNQRAAGRAPQP
jgi:GAF domain-containing protein